MEPESRVAEITLVAELAENEKTVLVWPAVGPWEVVLWAGKCNDDTELAVELVDDEAEDDMDADVVAGTACATTMTSSVAVRAGQFVAVGLQVVMVTVRVMVEVRVVVG